MKRFVLIAMAIFAAACVYSETNTAEFVFDPGVYYSLKGAAVHNFKTDVDGGGDVSVDRYYAQAGVAYMWNVDQMVAFSFGAGRDDYRFSGRASDPWNKVDNYRVSTFVRWKFDGPWAAFAAPSLRSYGETGSDFDDTLTASFFGGASYRFNEKLTMGPGFGVSGQLEDDTRFFPFLIIDWKITDRLNLGTGGGTAASAGPGLALGYKLSKHWKLGLAARYERKRFRLDSNGLTPGGIGEDRNIPILGSIEYILYPGSYISGIFGYNFGGKYRLNNSHGGYVLENDYDDAPFVGVVASIVF
jgi:hypothetical protein